MHNAAFTHLGLDWTYVALPVRSGSGAAAVEAMRTLGIEGLSVTMPHKQAVAMAVDELSPAAAALGAVNCVQTVGDQLIGHNTDGAGFVRSARELLDFEPHGATVAVIGAGGAAAAVVMALVEAGATVVVLNRSADKARRIAALAGPAVTVGGADAVADSQLIVQCTPLGMRSQDPLPVAIDDLREGQLVADLIYHPAETPLLRAARERGLRCINGVGMLLFQAGEQFALWTGEQAPIEIMAAAVDLEL